MIVTGACEECLEQPSPKESRTTDNRLGIVELKHAENRSRMVSAPVNDAPESNRFASRQGRFKGEHHHSKTKVTLGRSNEQIVLMPSGVKGNDKFAESSGMPKIGNCRDSASMTKDKPLAISNFRLVVRLLSKVAHGFEN